MKLYSFVACILGQVEESTPEVVANLLDALAHDTSKNVRFQAANTLVRLTQNMSDEMTTVLLE